MDLWVRGPGKDKQTNRDKPAGDHHWDETGFGRRLAAIFGIQREIVLVDEGGAGCAHHDTDSKGNKHETG